MDGDYPRRLLDALAAVFDNMGDQDPQYVARVNAGHIDTLVAFKNALWRELDD